MFLGWCHGALNKHDFFVRQLRDMKLSPVVETFGELEFGIFAVWCGRALALSHARSGNPSMLSGYMGKGDVFDKAIASFATVYADQNESDHAALARAVKAGKVLAVFEEAVNGRERVVVGDHMLMSASRRPRRPAVPPACAGTWAVPALVVGLCLATAVTAVRRNSNRRPTRPVPWAPSSSSSGCRGRPAPS